MKNFSLILITVFFQTQLLAKAKVSNVDFAKDGKFGVTKIKLKGEYRGTPELTIKDDMVQVEIPNTIVWPKVEKKFSVHKKFDSTMMAYQFNKKLVRVRTILPYDLKGNEDKVSMVVNGEFLELYYPIIDTPVKAVSKAIKKGVQKKEAVETINGEAGNYDETYLAQLLQDKSNVKDNTNEVPKSQVDAQLEKAFNDKVSTSNSAVKKEGGFDMSSYIFKFIGFFSLLVVFIYGVMNLFRKGMLKRGGLGFLSNAKMVEVLSTTYIAPKRSVLVLRVHKQVFLVAQSEKGMDLLTEIKDTTAFMKEGEVKVTGNNFDTDLNDASKNEKEFNLKDLVEETPSVEVAVKNENKLSSQIKNKLKDLKQFQ